LKDYGFKAIGVIQMDVHAGDGEVVVLVLQMK